MEQGDAMTSTSNGGGETYLNKAVEIVISSIPGAKIRSPLPSSFNDYLPTESFLFQYTVPCSFKVSAPIMARRSSSRSSQGVPISYLYKGSGEAEELRENDNDGGNVEDVNETPPHVGAMDRRYVVQQYLSVPIHAQEHLIYTLPNREILLGLYN